MKRDKNEPIVTLSDLFTLYKRNKRKIWRTSICCAMLFCFWPVTTPVLYWAKGTFRDKGSTAAGMSSSFNAALVDKMGVKSLENEATTTMKSRTLLRSVVEKLHLNGSIHEIKPNSVQWTYIPRLFNHLYTEYRLFFYKPLLFYKDPVIDLAIEDIKFEGEEPYGGIEIVFTSDDTYDFFDRGKGLVMQGRLNEPLATDAYSFTLVQKSDSPLTGKKYSVSIRPYDLQVSILSGHLKVKADKEDKTLVHIEYTDQNRHMAAKIINTLMEVYQDYKTYEIRRIAESQLDYLAVRHKQINDLLSKMMSDHAQSISNDLLKIGFPNAQSAIDFLSKSQSQQQQRLLTIDLETKRLEQAKAQGYTFFDAYTPHGDPGIINQTLAEIRELKKQSDNIQLSLHHTMPRSEQESIIEKYVTELDQIASISTATRQFLDILKSGKLPETVPPLLTSSKYLVKSWWLQLQNSEPAEQEKVKTQFVAYLEQLLRLFDVHTNTLKERLTRHQNPTVEFEGIDLGSARELYINYSKQLNELEAHTAQHEYILGEIENPDFEITSLSSVLTDGVSHEMITQTSRLALQLNDTHNRSLKEQQRIREEIGVKKGFLTMHLKNAAQLLVLRQNMMRDKIRTLQETTLALMQQQISLLEKHLSDYLGKRIDDLRQEKEILLSHQRELNSKMAALPHKLSEEKLIDQQLRINTGVADEVSRLIESKNLASNLEVSRSVPVEVATPPIKPKSPKLLFFAIFGAFFGFFVHVSALIARTLMHGMPVSRDNLKASGYHVAGALTANFDHSQNQPLRDSDLETLRSISAFLPNDSLKHSLLVGEDKGPNFSHTIARLLSKRGLKILLLNLSFNSQTEPGLLQFLEGEVTHPAIQKGEDYDTILSGGISRFSNELISSKQFQNLLSSLKEEYDWVIGVSQSPSLAAETRDLLSLFEYGVFMMTDQVLQSLPPSEQMQKVTLIVKSE